ncbi:uroporphyrinogen-III C-methyltransferase [Shewanella waksmanii]|uniref:uroporphyrinogen-III C-methyltransferase n=1 Tax=Shewanella waksmanii TaxID=213783 RepID=UPI0037363766
MDNKDQDSTVESKSDVQTNTNEASPTVAVQEVKPEVVNEAPQAAVHQEQPAADISKKGVSWGVFFNLLLILILAFTASAGGYFLYQEQNKQLTRSNELAEQVKVAISDPAKRITQLEQQLRQAQQQNVQAMQQVEDEQQQLQQRIEKLALRSPNHWMAEEAKYLVRMAGNKLWLENDPRTAASLLTAADERIESMKDPALMPLRKALAADMRAVGAVKSTDVAGTALTIDSIIENIHKLPLNRADIDEQHTSDNLNQMTDSIDDWRSNLAHSWQALLEEFVVIRKRTADHGPLLAPDQQWYLVENIKSKLLQSQLALFRQDEVNYRQSIRLARQWVFQYFNLKDAKTEETLAALDALATLELQTPSISHFSSTALLQQLVNHGNLLTTEENSL